MKTIQNRTNSLLVNPRKAKRKTARKTSYALSKAKRATPKKRTTRRRRNPARTGIMDTLGLRNLLSPENFRIAGGALLGTVGTNAVINLVGPRLPMYENPIAKIAYKVVIIGLEAKVMEGIDKKLAEGISIYGLSTILGDLLKMGQAGNLGAYFTADTPNLEAWIDKRSGAVNMNNPLSPTTMTPTVGAYGKSPRANVGNMNRVVKRNLVPDAPLASYGTAFSRNL